MTIPRSILLQAAELVQQAPLAARFARRLHEGIACKAVWRQLIS